MQITDTDPVTILVAEDDPDHQILIKEALNRTRVLNDISFVENGQEALDFLRHKGKYLGNKDEPPGLILLDLNMPLKSGHEVLHEIKGDPDLRSIPVVILTTSDTPEDISNTYDLGANSYITKPVSFDRLVEVICKLTDYWFQIVRLPDND